jgi:hypothetical protein
MNLCPVALSSSACRNLASGASPSAPKVIGTLLCLLVCAGLLAVPGLLCVGCYRLGQRLRRGG